MSFNRRDFLQSMGAAAGVTALSTGFPLLAGTAQAASTAPSRPPMGRQVPGLYRTRVGDLTVTAVLDGGMEFSGDLFPKTSPEDIRAAQRRFYQSEGPVKAYLNSFVVQTGRKTILIDSGYGTAGGETVGKLLDNLDAAGIRPADITDVYLTHAHPDHVNGLIDAKGHRIFERASVRLAADELQYWFDDAAHAAAPEGKKGLFTAARQALTPYRETGQIETFARSEDLGQGVHVVDLPGHTPGHSGFRLTSGKDQLLIWGDVIHAPVLQFAHPEWNIAFDTDAAQAARVRDKILAEAAADRIRIAGMHLVFPALGHVAPASTGYDFYPQMWEV